MSFMFISDYIYVVGFVCSTDNSRIELKKSFKAKIKEKNLSMTYQFP